MDSGKVITDIELLKIARERTASYVDMGHFRDPREATPYLIDGFQRGYRHAEKELKLERDELKGKLVEKDLILSGVKWYFDQVECQCSPEAEKDPDERKCLKCQAIPSEALKEISKNETV